MRTKFRQRKRRNLAGAFLGSKTSALIAQSSVLFVVLSAILFALCSSVQAQQPGRVARIGYLAGGDANTTGPQIEAFRQGMRALGYVEGKNVRFEFRYVEEKQDRVPLLLGELLDQKVDVLVIPHTGGIFAAKQATKTIPIVMVSTVDPVTTGMVASLAHPGGNITGVFRLNRDLGGKRLELLKEAVPKTSRVAVLWDGNDEGSRVGFKEYETAAHALKLQLQSLEVRDPNPDFDAVLQAAIRGHANGLIVVRDPFLRRYTKRIADLAIKKQLPSMWEGSDSIKAGGLISYSTSDTESFTRAATYVDKILKGRNPADLPVEQPTKFELVINLKTAKQIDLTVPPNVLLRADKVIK
jgi:putative ABC transport system substrate-binding protein